MLENTLSIEAGRNSENSSESVKNQPSQTRRVLFQATTSNTIAQLSFNHYSALKCNHTIEEFHLTEPEMTAIKELEKMAFLYIAQR